MTENQVCDKSQIIPFLISISMSNGSQISNQVEACDLEEYTPVIDGWLFYLHTGMIFIIVWASFKIQRALIRTFKKLGSRHINSIVVPTIVSFEQNNRSEKSRWPYWLGLHSANSMVVGLNPTASNSKFCYFLSLPFPFPSFFLLFP